MNDLLHRIGISHALLLATLVALGAGCERAPDTTRTATDTAALEGTDMDRLPPPEDTEVWEPEPPVVTPGEAGAPPSDAIVLFDGRDLAEWRAEKGGDAAWRVADGAMTVAPGTGNIVTRRSFGSLQLHVEWRTPAEVSGEGQGRGNSGIYLMERYEIQVLDSYENRTYANGQAGAIYKQHAPLVNASRPPGEWQSYDVVFTAPRFDADGALVSPAWMSVFHNGVLIQNHVQLRGPTRYRGAPAYEAHADRAPLLLQDHDNPVSYRNIWVREIPGSP